jgi:hypothetical protein
MEDLQSFARSNGFRLVTRRSREGNVELQCRLGKSQCAPRSRPPNAEGSKSERKRNSDCPFRVKCWRETNTEGYNEESGVE